MANKKESLDVVRNTIYQIDDEIRKINNLIQLYEFGHGSVKVNGMSKSEREIRISVLIDMKDRFNELKHFVIYKS